MGALKGFSLWYPPERQSSMTGFVMSAGALGALTASVPLEALLPVLGWRGVFWIVAGLALALSWLIWRSLPADRVEAAREPLRDTLRGVVLIYRSPHFLRFAASATFFIGGFMALQALWVVPWLMQVNRFDLAQAAQMLVVMNLGMLLGQFGIGLLGTRLVRRGVRPAKIMQTGYAGVLVVQLAILLDHGPLPVLWFLFGLLSAVNSQTYLAAAEHFPRAQFGRVSTAINLMAFAGAFAVQWGMGLVLDRLQAAAWPMETALHWAFAGLIVLQLLSLLPLLPGGGLKRRSD
jgi:predicted MFS family arabinose efflux permease